LTRTRERGHNTKSTEAGSGKKQLVEDELARRSRGKEVQRWRDGMGVVGVSGDKLQEGGLNTNFVFFKIFVLFFFNFLKLSFLYLIFYKNPSSV